MKSNLFFPANFARLLLLIFTGLSVSSCRPPLKDFDLWADSSDPNGLALNPRWGRQQRLGEMPTPVESCPVGSTDPVQWLQAPNCTHMTPWFNQTTTPFKFCHHINFDPVTYEGTVHWAGASAGWPFGDNDYSFKIIRADRALYTTVDAALGMEFDTQETVNQWTDTLMWWNRFRRAVNTSNDSARAMIERRFAIVIGALGLDQPHGGRSELHPVYAMFVRLDEPSPAVSPIPSTESKWAFFVRNWGNEGFCGPLQVFYRTQAIRVQLPTPGQDLVDFRIRAGPSWHPELPNMNFSYHRNPEGMFLMFTLPPTDPGRWGGWWMGNLTLRGSPVITARTSGEETVASQGLPPRTDEPPDKEVPPQLEPLIAQIANLPASSREELLALLENAVPRRQSQPQEELLAVLENGVLRRQGQHQREARVVIGAPTQVRSTRRAPGRVVNRNLIRVSRDTVAELDQRWNVEVLRKFFAERGIRVDLPRQ